MNEQRENHPAVKKSDETIRALKVIFYPILGVFIITFLFGKIFNIPFFKEQPVVSVTTGSDVTTGPNILITGSTSDVTQNTGYIGTGLETLTGIDVELSDIDIVYGILETGKPGEDFSVISQKPQTMRYSTTVEDDFKQYLANNIYTVTMPKDIKGGYLYIKLRKPLKYMPNIAVYQPITLKTNIYVDGMGVYGRFDTSKSLGIYKDNEEFLYKLSDVSVKTAKHTHTSWLVKKGEQIQIGGFVSDTNGNYIENIIFIWER